MSDDWFQDPTFWTTTRDAMFTDARWGQAEPQVEAILQRAGLTPEETRVLDLPCGPGRHTLAFAARGCAVTGVDLTQPYLDEAARRAAEQGLEPTLLRADMRDLALEGGFDLAINLFSSFGYFADHEDDARVLRNFWRALDPGGWLVMEMVGLELLVRHFSAKNWWHDPAVEGHLLEHRHLDHTCGWLTNQWTWIAGDGTRHRFELQHRVYAAGELARLVERCGFTDVQITGSLDGHTPYSPDERLVLFARKPI